jgi:uncharacterized membrane protein
MNEVYYRASAILFVPLFLGCFLLMQGAQLIHMNAPKVSFSLKRKFVNTKARLLLFVSGCIAINCIAIGFWNASETHKPIPMGTRIDVIS